ncbi:MAG: patatin-like phospholipase family protein [Acidobacteria bacterium]|nr:patatin-like phospholipase family protein [Acidobacteriota bacterium]
MEHKKIGLALSGGGARGFAHIGVLKVFAEYDIKFDMIAGTSAGSIIGGCLAAGMTPDEMVSMSSKVGYLNMMRPSFSPRGLLSNAPMGDFLRRELPFTRFEHLPIPFAAVAYDLVAGRQVVLKESGDLVTAIRASCAVPGVFAPVKGENGELFVDGGVTNVMPVDVLREMGADIVIAVDLLACGSDFKGVSGTAVGIMIRSAMTLLRTSAGVQGRNADVVIVPPIAHLRPDQIGKRDEFYAPGESSARERIDEILAFIEQT